MKTNIKYFVKYICYFERVYVKTLENSQLKSTDSAGNARFVGNLPFYQNYPPWLETFTDLPVKYTSTYHVC